MSGEYLIIRSSDASRVTTILGDYKRRWEIETLFKALKSQGFDFAATHLTELDRIEKLLALLAIAFCWAHLLGEWLHEQKPILIIETSPSGHQYFQVWVRLVERDFVQYNGKA